MKDKFDPIKGVDLSELTREEIIRKCGNDPEVIEYAKLFESEKPVSLPDDLERY